MYLNKVILIGNITKDPELKALPSGVKVVSFSLATNRVWKDKDGKKQESADFHNIVVFGNQAETVAQYMKKGSSILIEGRLQTRSWEDKESGAKRYRTEIVADRTQFGPKSTAVKKQEEKADADDTEITYPEEDINPEDIPF